MIDTYTKTLKQFRKVARKEKIKDILTFGIVFFMCLVVLIGIIVGIKCICDATEPTYFRAIVRTPEGIVDKALKDYKDNGNTVTLIFEDESEYRTGWENVVLNNPSKVFYSEAEVEVE